LTLNTNNTTQWLSKQTKLLSGKMRRLLWVNIHADKVEAKIATREGMCHQCADCCRLLFRCPWLTKDNLCLVYHSPVRPKVCIKFPFDGKDIGDVHLSSGGQCGYRFPCPQKTDQNVPPFSDGKNGTVEARTTS
jgi:hypothetical protein